MVLSKNCSSLSAMARQSGQAHQVQLHLRDFSEADVDDFYEWASDEEVTRYMTWQPFKTKQDARDYLAKVAMPHPFFKAICLHGSNRPIGHVILKQGGGIHSCRAEIAYAISRKYWKMGVATRAVVAAVDVAARELPGIARIEALVLPENVASARVLEKAGFDKEVLLRNYVYLKGSVQDCFLFSYIPSSPKREWIDKCLGWVTAWDPKHLLVIRI